MPRLLASLLALALLLPIGAAPQEDPRARIRGQVELVVVPVTVKDRRGEFVLDIRREEFRIFEDDVEQEISLYTLDPFPISAVVLVDDALQGQFAERVEQSLGALAGGFGPSDEVAVALFETFFRPASDFVTDNDRLYEQLKRIQLTAELPGRTSGPLISEPRVNTAPGSGPGGAGRRSSRPTKNLDDAVHAAAQMFRDRPRDRRRILLVISDGENSRNNTVSFDTAARTLHAADATLYAVGVSPAILRRGSSVLEKYASRSGGEVFYGANRAEMENLYGRVAEQVRSQYTLGYVPRGTDRSREFHSIEVRVRRPGLSILARDGYFGSSAP